MKKRPVYLVLLAVAVMLFANSCVENSKQYKELAAERDSLLAVSQSTSNDFDSTMSIISEIENALAEVRTSEGIIMVDNPEDNGNQAVAQINALEQKLQENREKLDNLEKRLAEQGSKNKSLAQTIDRLQKEIDEKDKSLNDLKAQLQSTKEELQVSQGRVQELSGTVSNLNENINNLNSQNASQQAVISTQETAINTVYYCVSTLKNLKKMGLFAKGDVLKKSFDKQQFVSADKRKLVNIALNSKKASILTTHPEGSYELVKGEDGALTLHIIDAASFWNISNYLIVSIK